MIDKIAYIVAQGHKRALLFVHRITLSCNTIVSQERPYAAELRGNAQEFKTATGSLLTYYREMLDPVIRWTDRLQSSSGNWSGNLFDFYYTVSNKLTKDIKVPFKLEGMTRIDDTPVHKAIREALANCLINADFYIERGVVILKDKDKIVIQNPGSIRTGKDQMIKGGISDPRNKGLMKMFNMVAIGERAGSGVPSIFDVWDNQGWKEPIIEEQFAPDRTVLTLEFTKKQAIKTSDKKQAAYDR